MSYFIIITILIFFYDIPCIEGNMTMSIPQESGGTLPKYTNLMVLFDAILISAIFHAFLKNFNIPTPYNVLVMILGFVWGILANQNKLIMLTTQIIKITPDDILAVYVPVMVYNIAFCMDIFIFLKTLPQIMVIGVPVTLATGCLYGYLMKLIIDPPWPLRSGIIFGMFCTPIYPMTIVYLLKQQSTRTKHIGVLLEGEALVSFIVVNLVHNLMFNNMLGVIIYWYQFVLLLLRFLLLGILTGYILGLIGCYAMRKMYTNQLSIFMVAFAMPFFVYVLAKKYIAGSGSISVMIAGIMMGTERMSLSKEMDRFLIRLWRCVSFIMDVMMCFTTALMGTIHVAPFINWHHYIGIIVTYMMYYVVRFLCFLMFSPIISRLGYGINFRNMMVCVWGGLKSPYTLELVKIFLESPLNVERARLAFFHIVGLYFLSVLINGTFTRTLLDFMGLRQISVARQVNMTNCIKHIFAKRERTIAILKMDRFLGDTNWPTVIEATNIKHPYSANLAAAEEDVFFLGYRFTYCSDCKKDVLQEPTPKEMKEMSREGKMRVLKAKKMFYSRQYENGMVSKEGIRILSQAVEMAMDTEEAVIEVDGLQRQFTEENCLTRCIRGRVESLAKRNQKRFIRPPQTYWRRICYHIVVNTAFEKFMLFAVLCHLGVTVVDIYYHPSIISIRTSETELHSKSVDWALAIVKFSFCSLYIAEFVMKILAYSRISICSQGFHKYFTNIWYVFDFIVMIACILDVGYSFNEVATGTSFDKFGRVIDAILLLRFLRLLRIFEIFYPNLVKYLERYTDRKMAFTYELGKSYTSGEVEILEMLPYMIDNKKVREEVRRKIETDRELITKLVGMVQKEKPWIAITVKTKQSIRTILSSMKDAINQLKASGWVDDYELEKLTAAMEELYKKASSIARVLPSPPKVIFKEVAWMAGDEAVIDFLFENVTVKRFEPGEVVFGEGNVNDGIYIVVTGLFKISYIPDKNILESLHEYGRLPIVDYLSCTLYEESAMDYIVSGNCIGELSTLTQRPFNCTITADAHSQVYVLSYGIIKRAMELSSDPVLGLECRIWKEVSIRLAVPLLMRLPAYQTFSQDQIKYALERAFVPNLSNYKIFAVTDMIQNIVLIDGVVADFNTRECFIAPCCIPRTAQKLILPTSSLMNIPIDIETKLLIIPEKDVDGYDVMMMAEDTCEMVENDSETKCLQHIVQHRSKNRRYKRGKGLRRSLTSHRRDADGATMSIAGSSTGGSVSAGPSSYGGTSEIMFFNKQGDPETASMYFGEEEEKHNIDYQVDTRSSRRRPNWNIDDEEKQNFDYQADNRSSRRRPN